MPTPLWRRHTSFGHLPMAKTSKFPQHIVRLPCDNFIMPMRSKNPRKNQRRLPPHGQFMGMLPTALLLPRPAGEGWG